KINERLCYSDLLYLVPKIGHPFDLINITLKKYYLIGYMCDYVEGSIKFNSQLLHIWPDDDMIRIAFGDSYKEAVTLFKYVDLIEMVYKIENPINRYDSYEILPEKYLNGDESSDSRINEHDNYIIIQHIVDSNGIIFLNLIDRRRKHEAFVSSNLDRKSINNGNIQGQTTQHNFKNTISSRAAHANSTWGNKN
ncbi:24388_t:CDS:2, partial [Entrophospora sp. SA101]